ncbi:MAG: histone deacetylase [Syntrophorhabdales bacterium]|jgi:acetoin utilization deacetylase AcuC-like enzyme
MKVGIVKDEIYLEHITDDFHPENPGRLTAIYSALEEVDQKDLVYVPARFATQDELALNHDRGYIRMVAETKGRVQTRLDPDTVASARSYEAACMAAGGFLQLIDRCMAREIDSGFALVRPPGHHAERGRSMGFCIFNNIAIGARYVEKKYGLKRALIVDFDLHHGNGTQHSFYGDSAVLYMSTHQYPYYPGTGWYDELGEGQGKGYTINIPLGYGMNDADYLHVFREVVVPVSRLFRPEIVLVSAGFDIHGSDPLGGMAVTERGFAGMTRMLMDIAAHDCEGRLLLVLEGGYDITALANSVRTVIMELKETPLYIAEDGGDASQAVRQVVSKVKEAAGPYWGKF